MLLGKFAIAFLLKGPPSVPTGDFYNYLFRLFVTVGT